jgi:hypothetical protein
MSELFDLCVAILYGISDLTGLTYKEVNIWIFVIIHPLITASLIYYIFKLRIKLKRLTNF